MAFPPRPAYPAAYDNDRTLFLVHNTAESVTTADVPAWADEVPIRAASGAEVWADNGFANIGGELFYYDAVEKDGDGKVVTLRRCLRNLGGTPTKFSPLGTDVRGYVVAEHHNQLTAAVLKIEGFVGENFTLDKSTLDWRIRNLREIPVIFDDFSCPDVIFNLITEESNPASGTLVRYEVVIDGQFTSFRIDFGDGDFTTNTLSGTHRYAASAAVNPSITVTNSRCTIVQTPVIRESPLEPPDAGPPPPFEIPIPGIPPIPDIVFPEIIPPSVAINFPPIVFPCLDLDFGPGIGNIPSVITVEPPINIPSTITFSPINIPSTITFSPVEFPDISIAPIAFGPPPSIAPIAFGPANVPSEIEITGCDIPDEINVICCDIPTEIIIIGQIDIPGEIIFSPIDIPSQITISCCDIPSEITITGGDISVTVDWGDPPILTCEVVVICPSSSPSEFRAHRTDFDGGLSIQSEVTAESLGIPHEIELVVPKIPDIKVQHDLPSVITVSPIPDIKVVSDVPREINVNAEALPRSIEVTSSLPSVISLDASALPTSIRLEVSDDFPSVIRVEMPSEIQVVGIPPTIELKGTVPSEIKLVMPDKPEVEMVYKGPPIEMKIQFDKNQLEESGECVKIVPCRVS